MVLYRNPEWIFKIYLQKGLDFRMIVSNNEFVLCIKEQLKNTGFFAQLKIPLEFGVFFWFRKTFYWM